ncbi:glycosyltransferase [Williamsia sp. SKLECPSW1]
MFWYDKVRAECRVILALPDAQIDESPAPRPRGPHLVFLGTFERRKGILELLAAWDQVRSQVQNAELTIIGSGEHQSAVEVFVRERAECSLVISPARDEIFALLKQAKALALLSQREVGWREQVGLPIVEALSVGCEIITTEETGIADWLIANGHQVLSTDATTTEIAASLMASLLSGRTPFDVLGSLPLNDGRMEAESWLLDASR